MSLFRREHARCPGLSLSSTCFFTTLVDLQDSLHWQRSRPDSKLAHFLGCTNPWIGLVAGVFRKPAAERCSASRSGRC